MKANIISGILLLLFGLSACVSRSGHLSEIDGYMETDPGRALEELERVQSGELSSADTPYYALLYTQAQIKNNIALTSDSLMKYAYEAYRNSPDKDLRKRAHFYNAQIAYYAGNLRPAMADVVVAYDIAKSDGDPYWIAKTAELIGDIFYDSFNFQQAEMFERECVENYKKAGRTDNHRYALSDLAATLIHLDKRKESIAILDSLHQVIKNEEPFDSALYNYAIFPVYAILIDANQLDSLERLLPEHSMLSGDEGEFDYAVVKSYLLDEEESRQLLWEAYTLCPDDKHRARTLYAAYRQALISGNYKYAAEMADSVILYQDKISVEALKESVVGVQRDFYTSKADFEAQKSRSILYTLIAVVVVAIVIVILLVAIHRLKMRAKKAELEANISTLVDMKNQVTQANLEKERLNVALSDKSLTIESLFKDKWAVLNMLCNEYFELGDSESARVASQARIEKELKKLRTTKSLKDIEAAVDANMGGIMALLRQECDFLKEDDFVFLSLVYAGLSAKAVCLFTDIKYKNFYQKKSRLSKRIADSEAPHKDLFTAKIC
ncbi:MAG: hypothetical protein K2N16_00050 [Muribaculaceae bacterium]|nr:hypothetical protein [Muribaculaceae bacterium]